MAQSHDATHDSNDSSALQVAVYVGIGAIALVIGIILMAQLAIGLYGSRSRKDDPSMAAEAVAKRIAPVASVSIGAAPPAPAPAPVAAAAPAAAKAPAAANGKATYDATCAVCHGAGVAGAPKFGDKAAWAQRLAAGKDALYASALKGKGAMPAKGGNAALDEAAVKAAVDHMVAAAK